MSARIGDRQTGLARLREGSDFSVVIVGGGINGLGTFRDLCLQGVDCLLIDRGDFCAGTSAAPSRMIHGGLKYLETGEFRLVAESVRERNQLLRNAAHLVKPLELVIPLRSWLGGELASLLRFLHLPAKIRRRGWLITKLGLSIYDYLARHNRVAPQHQMISRGRLHALLPDIAADVKSAAVFFDGQIEMPERLCVELALDAMADEPRSLAVNHVALEGLSEGRLKLRDSLTGERFQVGTQLVINAAGPWIDRTNATLQEGAKRLIGGTKGSHLMLDMPALHDQLGGRMIYFDPGDGRICLVSALSGKVQLGSTDIPVSDADQVQCDDEEVDYMLGALHAMFPGLKATREDIVFSYCGVRPLPHGNVNSPGEISRDHSIDVAESSAQRPFPVLSLVGGKWSTYRAFGEQATDMALQRLGRTRRRSTLDESIGGGRGLTTDAQPWQTLLHELKSLGVRERAGDWIRRYGRRALTLAHHAAGAQDRPVDQLPEYTEQEIRFLVETEMVQTLEDLVLRRMPIGLNGRLNAAVAFSLARLVAGVRGWSEQATQAQMEALAAALKSKHRIDLATGKFV